MSATAARVCLKSQVIDFPRSTRLSRIKHVAKSICGGRISGSHHILRIQFFFLFNSFGNTFICYVKLLESGVTPLNVQFDVCRRGTTSGIPRPSELRSHRFSGRAFHAYFEKLECWSEGIDCSSFTMFRLKRRVQKLRGILWSGCPSHLRPICWKISLVSHANHDWK